MTEPLQLKSIKQLDVVLASEAVWRSDILKQLGIPHRCTAHQYDEPKYSTGDLAEFVQKIALEKGKSIQAENPNALIISADQLIALDEEVFGKAGSRENSIKQLTTLSGKKHRLICAVAVLYKGGLRVEYEEAKLTMRQLTLEEITNYVDHDQPWNCAGSYKIESLGAALFEAIEVRDPNTIVGIPGNLLINILRDWGFSNLI